MIILALTLLQMTVVKDVKAVESSTQMWQYVLKTREIQISSLLYPTLQDCLEGVSSDINVSKKVPLVKAECRLVNVTLSEIK